MAILGVNNLSLLDWAKRLDPDGKVSKIVELLSEQNEILQDMSFMEGNLPTGHRTSVRTGLPTVYWRKVNAGVSPSKSTTAQIDETIGMLEAWSEVDKDLAELQSNLGAFRLSEASAFLESMNQEMAETFFYGNDVDGSGVSSAEFNGLSVRYNAFTNNGNSENVIDAAQTAEECSVWLVVHGQQSVHGIFPKGSQAGLKHSDMGLVTIQDANDTADGSGGEALGQARMRVYQDHFQWKAGLVVKDWRYAVRICNLDITETLASASNLIELMVKAFYKIPNLKQGKAVFYMNRTMFQALDIQRMNKIGDGSGYSNLTYDTVDGKSIASFRGIPIKICDALLNNETAVPA